MLVYALKPDYYATFRGRILFIPPEINCPKLLTLQLISCLSSLAAEETSLFTAHLLYFCEKIDTSNKHGLTAGSYLTWR